MNQSSYDELNGIGNTSAQDAINATTLYMDASLGRYGDGVREKGMILTKKELVALHLYEQAGLRLPTQMEQVVAYLGYESGAGRELEPRDFQKTFTLINAHARRWNPIRQRIKDVSGEMKVFASQMLTYGNAMRNVLADIRGTKTLDELGIRTVEDLKRVKTEMGDRFPGIELDKNDADTSTDFGHYLDQMLGKIRTHHANAEHLKNTLASFGDDLAYQVRPQINLKLVAIDNTPLKADVIELKRQMDARALEIDEKNAAYKKLVEESLTSAASMNLFGLGMAIYSGVEAERIRKERNELKAVQARQIKEMAGKNQILARLSVIKADMQDLELLAVDADVATNNLITVWNKLHTYAEQSRDEADSITDALRARLFITHFEQVVTPWELVGKEADELLNVFVEADLEIKRLR